MNTKISTGPKNGLQSNIRTASSTAESAIKRKSIDPMDISEKKSEVRSKKFRKIAEQSQKNRTSLLAEPTENIASAQREPLLPDALGRYSSLKSLIELLPSDAASSSEILTLAEKSFDAGIPYFLAKQKTKSPPIYRDASTLFDFLFYQQHTFYDIGTEKHSVWKKHVDEQEFLLFTGSNAAPVSMGGIYKMLEDGLDIFALGLLLTASNPKTTDFANVSKELITLLFKENYLPSRFMPKHVDLLDGLSASDRKDARTCLAVSFSSADGSPFLKSLLDEGISVNQRDVHTGFVPLTTAIVNSAKTNIDLLIKHGADLNVDKEYLEEDGIITDKNKQMVMWARSEATFEKK